MKESTGFHSRASPPLTRHARATVIPKPPISPAGGDRCSLRLSGADSKDDHRQEYEATPLPTGWTLVIFGLMCLDIMCVPGNWGRMETSSAL